MQKEVAQYRRHSLAEIVPRPANTSSAVISTTEQPKKWKELFVYVRGFARLRLSVSAVVRPWELARSGDLRGPASERWDAYYLSGFVVRCGLGRNVVSFDLVAVGLLA